VLILWRIKSWVFPGYWKSRIIWLVMIDLPLTWQWALAQSSRMRDLPIGVYPRLGEVRLSGAVHTSPQKAVAEEIVQHFPGVRSVPQ